MLSNYGILEDVGQHNSLQILPEVVLSPCASFSRCYFRFHKLGRGDLLLQLRSDEAELDAAEEQARYIFT